MSEVTSVSSVMDEEDEMLLRNRIQTLKDHLSDAIQKDKLKFALFDLKRTVDFCKDSSSTRNAGNNDRASNSNEEDPWVSALSRLGENLSNMEQTLSSSKCSDLTEDLNSSMINDMSSMKNDIIRETNSISDSMEEDNIEEYTQNILTMLLVALGLWIVLQIILSA